MNTVLFHSYVESSKQTELINKIETDSQMESRMTATGGRLGDGGTEQKGKRTHGRRQQCGYFWG